MGKRRRAVWWPRRRARRSPSRRSWCPTPGRARRSSPSRRAACATPTCTTARAASTTTSPSCSGHEAAGVVESVGAGVTDLAPGRLRRPELAGRVRRMPGLPARPALVLLRHPQRHAEDDAGRRDAALPRPRHRRLRRADAGGGRAVHQGQPRRPPRGGRAARLRCHGRHRRRHVHRPGRPRRLGGRLRLRRRRVCRRRRVEARRGGRHHRRRPRPAEARAGHRSSAPPTPSTPAPPIRSRRSRR